MAETVKFTEEELVEIKQLQTTFQQATFQAGRYYFEKETLNRKKEIIDSYFENAKQQETALIQKFNEKYVGIVTGKLAC